MRVTPAMRFFYRWTVVGILLSTVPIAWGQTSSFKDLPSNDPAFEAVEYLKGKGVISGFPDGTFRAKDPVTRAQAVKIIVGSLVAADQLKQFSSTPFTDVPAGDWSVPYIEAARRVQIIDSPPKTSAFNGGRKVTKSEFLKIMLLARRTDMKPLEDIKLPLADDVTSADEWYYPYIKAGIFHSMDMVGSDGKLHPAKELSRGEVSLMLYRYLMYKDGRRTQALLVH